jgi:DNA-binding MarR family transcriptional regulator
MTEPSTSPHVLTAWHALLQVSSRVVAELDRRLDLEHRITVREFDVLITLDNAGGGLRMTDLADAVMLSSGGLTRLVGRLEERGFLRREPDPSDGRGSLASLTGTGRARLGEARTTHDAVISELLGAKLSQSELLSLEHALRKTLPQGHRLEPVARVPPAPGSAPETRASG